MALWWKLSSCFLFLADKFHDSQPHKAAFTAKELYTLYFVLMSTSLLLKKCRVAPIIDLAFLMRALISASSFSSVVMNDPRYLKLCVKQTCWLFGRLMLGGRVPFAVSFLASLRDSGKNIASVFDFVLLLPTCICMPSLLKCSIRIGVRVSISSRLSATNTLSSTKNTLLNSKAEPLDVVGCPVSLPFSAFKLPFFGGLKYRNSEGFISIFRVSRNACMIYANNTGEALSPCCTPVL